MPKTKISEFSATPANNTDIDSINIAEGCSPSGINDAIRELMAQLKDFQTGAVGDSFNGPVGTTTAAAGAFTTLSASSTVTLSGGTANGVAYLNGSKVVTSGSALSFDGSNVGVSATVASATLASSGSYSALFFTNSGGATKAGTILTNSSGILQSRAETSAWTNYDASSEYMRLTSTGLGIGTSSPSAKLTVVGSVKSASATQSSFYLSNAAQTNGFLLGRSLGSDDGQNFFIYDTVAAATRLYLDSSGNLGLGVTPSAWSSSFKALQVSPRAALWGDTSQTILSHNIYATSGGDLYIANGNATLFTQQNGAYKWLNAPSGTAGNAITFTQAMTLDASGRLLVGTTTSSGNIATFKGSQQSFIIRNGVDSDYNEFGVWDGASDGLKAVIKAEGGLGKFGTRTNSPMVFQTNDTERARIDSSGNLLVGTTSASGILTVVQGGSNANGAFITNQTYNYQTLGLHNTATANDNLWVVFGTEASFTGRGSISYNRAGGLTMYNTTSDYRAKDISGSVTDSGALIDSVPVYMGKMKGATQERPMFIAHETPAYAHTGVKDAVDADGNPVYQQMDASALIPVMWAEIQSLRQRVAQLESN